MNGIYNSITFTDVTATGLPNNSIYLLGRNGGGLDHAGNATLSAAGFGQNMTGQNMLDLEADILAYEATLGR